MASEVAPRTITLRLSKSTKGTFVYDQEVDIGGDPVVLKNVYIEKWALTDSPPTRITITITPIE